MNQIFERLETYFKFQVLKYFRAMAVRGKREEDAVTWHLTWH